MNTPKKEKPTPTQLQPNQGLQDFERGELGQESRAPSSVVSKYNGASFGQRRERELRRGHEDDRRWGLGEVIKGRDGLEEDYIVLLLGGDANLRDHVDQ